MPFLRELRSVLLLHASMLMVFSACIPASAQNEKSPPTVEQPPKPAPSKQAAQPKQVSPEEELQITVENAGSDRAALVRNLELFLKKYPESPQRPQIYRALVEASMQLRDTARAADYAERTVSLTPNDMSITLLAIQLLERNGDEPGLRRAVNYSSRVLEYVGRTSVDEKSPKVSLEDWTADKKRNQTTILNLRGRLYFKLHDLPSAQKDFTASYALLPGAVAAEKLGEIAELQKDLPRAINEYARAFALGDPANGPASRHEVRQKLGNVWRLAHGSEDGLGAYLLNTYDEVAQSGGAAATKRNAGAKEPFDFTLRKAPDGSAFPLSQEKGKILVVNFWATWCGPCHALEPLFERVATQFQQGKDVVFLSANCDDDETLVPPYLEEEKLRTTVVYADGLERFFSVNSFPTVLIIDRAGKIVYRTDGFGPDTFEQDLTAAVRRTINPSEPAPAPPMATSPHEP
jgi:thiol-disulfide isomerase/thioredoxin